MINGLRLKQLIEQKKCAFVIIIPELRLYCDSLQLINGRIYVFQGSNFVYAFSADTPYDIYSADMFVEYEDPNCDFDITPYVEPEGLEWLDVAKPSDFK